MFRFKENGKEIIYLTANEAISSYMLGFSTPFVPHTTLSKWGKFLEDKLSSENREVKVICGEEALKEVARDELYFEMTEEATFLRSICELEDLGNDIIAYLPYSVAEEISKTTESFNDLDEEENEG